MMVSQTNKNSSVGEPAEGSLPIQTFINPNRVNDEMYLLRSWLLPPSKRGAPEFLSDFPCRLKPLVWVAEERYQIGYFGLLLFLSSPRKREREDRAQQHQDLF
jgi:hypothetical protein